MCGRRPLGQVRTHDSCMARCKRSWALATHTCSVCKAHKRGRGADGRGVHGEGFSGSQGLLKLAQKQGGSCLAPGCRPGQCHVQALEALQQGALSLRAALGQVSTCPDKTMRAKVEDSDCVRLIADTESLAHE